MRTIEQFRKGIYKEYPSAVIFFDDESNRRYYAEFGYINERYIATAIKGGSYVVFFKLEGGIHVNDR